ncbi:MAG: hypothetical protein KAH25_09835 [Bacteroidales bacterium]|nr:hypothetical protein [Bacteroidales bacterium]
MKYSELTKLIKNRGFKRILVTGPHRSGTTFAGAALASDIGVNFYPEENIRGGSLVLFNAFNRTHKQYVIQAPGLSVNCHKVDVDLVVFMQRNLPDIMDGMRILRSEVIQYELKRIEEMYGAEYAKLGLPLAKLAVFTQIQQPLIDNTFILDYESLDNHKLWVPEDERKNWHIRQLTNEQGH